ncbi:MAG: hydrogenase maturation nickel metallochaperone HypA [Roseburia sp.]|nr:hydrogenase maturation nickel metallochaperone HypA [Roseburia sp.]
MHEMGIAFHIAESVTKIAEANQAEKVCSVVLEIGEASGVIPEYLMDVWTWNSENNPLLEGSELKVERIRAVTLCKDCSKTYDTISHGSVCPFCGSRNTAMIAGKEFNIKEIIVE